MDYRPRPFDIVHVSSAHPWTDNRVHLRSAATAAATGYRTALVAVSTDGRADRDWDDPDPTTGVYVRRLRRRRRAARVTLSTAQAVRAAWSSRARVVHLHDPELLWSVPLLRAAGRAVVYDAHEDLPAQVAGKEYLGRAGRRLAMPIAHAAIAVARRASFVVAATPTIAERFDPKSTEVVRNFPRLRAVDHGLPPSQRRRRIAYLGALNRDRGLSVVTALAGSLHRAPGWSLVVAGQIDAAVDRRAFDAQAATGRIAYAGVLAPDAARDVLLDARIGIVPLLPTPAFRTAIPTKLLEYLAAGLAVIATDVPAWRALVDGFDCVTWVPPDDPEAILRAVQAYDDDPALLDRHGRAAAEAARTRLHWGRESGRLTGVYRRLGLPDPIGGLLHGM